MTEVSFAVQAHPSRRELAEPLAASIGAEVCYDPDPDGPPSAWRTFRHLLELTPAGATHRFQIQDDAEACPGLAGAVRAAAAAKPDRLLVFFVGLNPTHHAQAIMEACSRDLPWAELAPAYWTPVVATCWPAPLIADLLEYVDGQRWRDTWGSDDERVGRFVRSRNIRPLASVPSLVEHPDLVPSVITRHRRGDRRRGRVATCYVGDCDGCLEQIDWTRGP